MIHTLIISSTNVLFKTPVKLSRVVLASSMLLLTACIATEETINADNLTGGGSSSSGGEGGVLTTDASPEVLQRGLEEYIAQCAICHDDPNTPEIDGDLASAPINITNYQSVTQLFNKIATTMPPDPLDKCDGECAEATTAFIINNYLTTDEYALGDDDGDGWLNGDDACPTEDGTDGLGDGCPIVIEVFDDDNDGIPNAEDACPNTIGVSSLDPEENGCPVEVFFGDVANGEVLYIAQCATCHDDASGVGQQIFGAFDNSDIFDASGTYKCELVNCSDKQALSDYLVTDMPFGTPQSCGGDCANDITAYLGTIASDGGVSNNGL